MQIVQHLSGVPCMNSRAMRNDISAPNVDPANPFACAPLSTFKQSCTCCIMLIMLIMLYLQSRHTISFNSIQLDEFPFCVPGFCFDLDVGLCDRFHHGKVVITHPNHMSNVKACAMELSVCAHCL